MSAPHSSPSLNQLEQQLVEAADALERASAAVALARALRNLDPVRGAALAEQALAQIRGLDAPPAEALRARALATLGLCRRNSSALESAVQGGREAVARYAALAEEPVLLAEQSWARSHLGITLCMLGDNEGALRQFEQARDLSRRCEDREGEADALMNIAIVANQIGDDERAIAMGEQLAPLYEALGDNYHLASVLNNRAYAHLCLGNRLGGAAATDHFDRAAALISQALPLARQEADADLLAACMDTLSNALRARGDWAGALANLQQQLALAQTLSGRRMEAVTLATLGDVRRRSGELAAAIDALQQADALFESLQLAEQHAGALRDLSAALEDSGRLAEALAVHKRLHATALRHRSQAAEEGLHVLEARLRAERSEAELQLAQQRERELAALNARLVEADRQRNLLMAELERHSLEDSLTEVANRRAFEQRLGLETERSLRQHSPLALVLIDVDHFKQINDGHSHGVGDAVLRTVAWQMRRQLRQTDLLARFGGDEFALLLPDTPAEPALQLCEKLRQAVLAHDWSVLSDGLQVTLSIGVAAQSPARAADASHDAAGKALTEAADAALYRAKAAGRNCVRD
ncbi:MAG: hypothetical protein C0423_16220 [Methylibium sp.]|nr:hypothetical protein [Methylibium sp.]